MTRPVRARNAAVGCIQRAIQISRLKGTPRVALISDTPSFVKEIKQEISNFAEVSCLVEEYSQMNFVRLWALCITVRFIYS